MRIGLLGQFGSGNTGNDASLEAMLEFLRETLPRAELLCICSTPDAARDIFGIEAIDIGGKSPHGRFPMLANRLLWNVPYRLNKLLQAYVVARRLNALIVPGTGILDDFKERPLGWPFVVFRWSLAARIAGVPIAFVSIGAGPVRNGLSLWFLKTAAKCATYRSYRDRVSQDFMRRIGVYRDADEIFPDLAFRLNGPSSPTTPKDELSLSVGVGVMAYSGWFKNNPAGESIYRQYLGKLVRFTAHVLKHGHRVRLLIGDKEDQSVVDDFLRAFARTGEDRTRIVHEPIASIHDLKRQITYTDIVVASRFHNLVAALSLGRPVISLGYAAKNEALLRDMMLGAYCNHIETFGIDELIRQFDHLAGERQAARAAILPCLSRYRSRLAEQEGRLLAGVLAGPAGVSDRDSNASGIRSHTNERADI